MNMIMNEAASQNVCTLSWSAFCFPSFTLDKNHESYNFQLHIYKLRDRIIATKLHVQTFLFRISACLDPVIDLMLLSTGLKLHSKSNKKHWSELLNASNTEEPEKRWDDASLMLDIGFDLLFCFMIFRLLVNGFLHYP